MSFDLNKVNPFLGRLLIEVIRDAAEDHVKAKIKADTNVSDDFLKKFHIVGVENKKTPISKGKIVKMAEDTFGSYFESVYGNVQQTPKIGDIVLFIPNDSYKLDNEDKYHLITDTQIVAFIKGE